MTRFVVGQSITTTTPTIVVDAGLAIGTHRFQLVVVDSSGLRSVADVGVVIVGRSIVAGPVIPTPVVSPVTPIANPGVVPRKPRKPAR